jgi:hypothetical protein
MGWVLIDGIFRITEFQRGWPSLAALVLFVGAVQLVSLGIIGEYLSRIFFEVKGRPAYLVARVTRQDDDPGKMPPPGNRSATGQSPAARNQLKTGHT